VSTIYPRLAIDYGGLAAYYLPPYGGDWGPRIRRVQGWKATTLDDPLTDGRELSATARSAVRFNIEGEINKPTADEARTEMNNMLIALSGAGGIFRFFWFHDQYWRRCFVENQDDIAFDMTRAPFGVIGYRIRFTAGDPAIYDDDSVGAGPYEDDIYPGETGATMSAVKQKTSYPVVFPGEIQVTPAGQDFLIVPEGESGTDLGVASIQATCSQLLGTSGSTQIRVCDAAKGGATTNSILLTLNHDERSGRNTGAFTINAGDSLYVYCESAAGHQDLMVSIVVEG